MLFRKPQVPLGRTIADQVVEHCLQVLEKFFFVRLEGRVPAQRLIDPPRLGMSQVSRASLRTTRTTLPVALQAGVLTLRMENLLTYLQELLFRKAQFGHILGNRICRI